MIYNDILQRIMVKINKAFDYIEHTADTGVISCGMTMEEVFSNAAMGMFNLIADLDHISHTAVKEIDIQAEDENFETLLVEWLNELLYTFDVELLLFSQFDITSLSPGRLKARCSGERIDLSKHTIKMEIKATTYHMLTITKTDGIYRAQVIFDI